MDKLLMMLQSGCSQGRQLVSSEILTKGVVHPFTVSHDSKV